MNERERKVIDFQDHRFARVTKQVLDDETYLDKPVQKLVYAVLCMYANNKTMKSHPSIPTLAKKCCCSENSVRAALAKLESLELISVTRRKKGGVNFSNEYTLWVPPDWFFEGGSNNDFESFTV
ncbi:helix-turn-helix domain-containing protein [Terribacillus sp. 179-K 1B1 HS]|uniref:helix-turn-helix domain-containing protein n=1 Tax=Terribacillus sp. 179-K 1B1 HS TaxID=3142388 RepID=UPI0039A3F70D